MTVRETTGKDTGNVFLIGPMGAGKTTVGKLLARELDLRFLDSDQEIEQAANANISWIFDVEGESGFRHRESRMIARLTEQRNILLATGAARCWTRRTGLCSSNAARWSICMCRWRRN